MNYLGIDPGANGGFALVNHERKLVEYLDLSKGGPLEWHEWLAANKNDTHALIEQVHSMPSMSSQSMFTFGWNAGVLHLSLQVLEIPYLEIKPQAWQKGLGVPARNKKAGETQHQLKKRLREVAQRLFPTEKITANIADACLIAFWHAVGRD
jgi:Holliday junction resolvasome RuvABC endonuclease subunit